MGPRGVETKHRGVSALFEERSLEAIRTDAARQSTEAGVAVGTPRRELRVGRAHYTGQLGVPGGGASDLNLLSAGCGTYRDELFLGTEGRPRNYGLLDVPLLGATTLSGRRGRPRNYVRPDVPILGATPFSQGRARHPRNYGLQDVPPLQGNTFSGAARVTPATTFSRTCHISEQTLSQRRSVRPETTF